MPKTRNFSDREKRDPMRLLNIPNRINAAYLFMQTLSLMRREGNLFCLSATDLFAGYALCGCLQASIILPCVPGLKSCAADKTQLCPKKVFLCPPNGQCRTNL